ncbi:hypothetical protein JXA88_13185 [Candidatus Fermentibacteria bacterium]|nr:hypothetical protein [Candidatus Fermentibacteria bacterium]
MTRLLTVLAMLLLVLPACSGKSETPDTVVMNIAKSLDAGHPEAIWDALPASYQADIDSVRILFSARMDKDLYDKGFKVFGKLVNVFKTKGDFIKGTPMAQAIPQSQTDPATWDTMVAGMQTFATSELSTLDGLKKLNIRQFLSTSGSDISKQAVALSRMGPGEGAKIERLSDIQVTVVKQEKDRATLSIKAGDQTEEQDWVVVEDKWVPEDLATGWKVDELKDQIRAMVITPEQKTQVLMIMGMADGALDQLQNAATQEEFNQALQGIMGPLMGGMMGGGMMQEDFE